MEGRLVQCEACGTRMGPAVFVCPRCAAPFPGGLRGLDDYLKARHHNLRLAGLTVMYAWLVTSVTVAVTFTGIFIMRLG